MSVKQPVLKDVNLLSIILRLIKSHNGHYGSRFDVITGADLGGGGGGRFLRCPLKPFVPQIRLTPR